MGTTPHSLKTGMGWDGESGVTMGLGLVWSNVAQGTGKAPPQGLVTHEEPKGLTNWSPCWALLWAKSCWFEELPDPGAFTNGHQQRHLVSLPLSLLPMHHPSPWQAENILSPLHSTPSGDGTSPGHLWYVSGLQGE